MGLDELAQDERGPEDDCIQKDGVGSEKGKTKAGGTLVA